MVLKLIMFVNIIEGKTFAEINVSDFTKAAKYRLFVILGIIHNIFDVIFTSGKD
jgi:hypothetical protein